MDTFKKKFYHELSIGFRFRLFANHVINFISVSKRRALISFAL